MAAQSSRMSISLSIYTIYGLEYSQRKLQPQTNVSAISRIFTIIILLIIVLFELHIAIQFTLGELRI